MAQATNPLSSSFQSAAPQSSKETHLIAGIKCSVYGVSEVPAECKDVSVLWLLHPRLGTQESMEPLAHRTIAEWNKHLSASLSNANRSGLIAVAFDQRNHGTRLVDKLANDDWRSGNPRHAQDMFSCFQGTALDTSQLITYLPAYVFPGNEKQISDHLTLGVSLGGHAVWHCILQDPRITSAVSVIGCADYTRLMEHRAEKSKRDSWRSSEPPGSTFLGSRDFPKALMLAVEQYDPAGLFMRKPGETQPSRKPSEADLKRLVPLMQRHLQGKRIFLLAGGSDKLVPYSCSQSFMGWIKEAVAPNGWFAGHGTVVRDKVYDEVKHEMTSQMVTDSIEFLLESLEGSARTTTSSKI